MVTGKFETQQENKDGSLTDLLLHLFRNFQGSEIFTMSSYILLRVFEHLYIINEDDKQNRK